MQYKSTQPLLVLICLLLYGTAAQAWWDCNWKKRVVVTINNTSATTLTNYEVPITINTTNLPGYVFGNADRDFRAIDTNDTTLLNYFVEQHQPATTSYTGWVRVPSIAAGATKIIYIYYDNAAATSLSNAVNTFSQTGIRVWTRQSTADPTSRATYDTAFAAATDGIAGYGCRVITDWTNISNQNQFAPPATNSNILWAYLAFFDATGNVGNWGFRHGSDYGRGGGMYIDDGVIEEPWNVDMWWAGSYANPAQILDNNAVPLTAGFHALRSDGAEGCCDGAGSAQFRRPASATYVNWNTANLPSMRAPQCRVNGLNVSLAASPISITFGKTVLAFSDPVNGTVNPKLIPDSRARYTLSISNAAGPADSNSITMVDPIPANTKLYVGNLAGADSGPVRFTQGAPSSGLTYTFTALGSATDDVAFSNDNAATFNYTPVADANGFDVNVTHIRINPKLGLSCQTGATPPSGQFEFDVGIK